MDGGTAGFRDEMELVVVLPGAAQHLPSRPGDSVKQNLYILSTKGI